MIRTNPQPGDIVSIEWPGDTIVVRAEFDIPKGHKFQLRTDTLLQVVKTASSVVAPEQNHGAKPYKPRSVECKRCGATVFFFKSYKSGKWYTTNSDNRSDFHSKTCVAKEAV